MYELPQHPELQFCTGISDPEMTHGRGMVGTHCTAFPVNPVVVKMGRYVWITSYFNATEGQAFR